MTAATISIDRNDVAQYVDSLFLVVIILVIAAVAISWYQNIRGSIPYNRPLRAVTGFVEETTSPFLDGLRRVVPPLGAGGMSIDLSPMIGLMLLFVLRSVFVGLING
jgi:YggT family protein